MAWSWHRDWQEVDWILKHEITGQAGGGREQQEQEMLHEADAGDDDVSLVADAFFSPATRDLALEFAAASEEAVPAHTRATEESVVSDGAAEATVSASLKSYPLRRTENMVKRAGYAMRAHLVSHHRHSSWSIEQHELIHRIHQLQFFADRRLNDGVQQLLLRPECQQSLTNALIATAMTFWSKRRLVERRLPSMIRPSSGGGHGWDARAGRPLTGYADVDRLFMRLHGVHSQQEWRSSGLQAKLHWKLSYYRRQLLQRVAVPRATHQQQVHPHDQDPGTHSSQSE